MDTTTEKLLRPDIEKPDLPEQFPDDIKHLMEACWADSPASRPTFQQAKDTLKHMTKGKG